MKKLTVFREHSKIFCQLLHNVNRKLEDTDTNIYIYFYERIPIKPRKYIKVQIFIFIYSHDPNLQPEIIHRNLWHWTITLHRSNNTPARRNSNIK